MHRLNLCPLLRLRSRRRIGAERASRSAGGEPAHLRRDLRGEIRLVLAGKHALGDLIEDLRQLGRVVLTDSEDDGLAALAADRIPQGILEGPLAEKPVGSVGEEALLELVLLEGLLLILARVVGERNDESLLSPLICFEADIGRPCLKIPGNAV